MKGALTTITVAFGASTVTSNVASYFNEYQSTFTVGVSIVTCVGFIASIVFGIYLKLKADKRAQEAHDKAMENV